MTPRLVLERFTLLLLVTTVAIALFSFVAFLSMETLHWAIFPKLGARFFHLFLPLCLAAIFVFSAFNAALNIGLIAESRLRAPGDLPSPPQLWRSAAKLAGGLVMLLALLLLTLFFVNRSNIQSKIDEVRGAMALMTQRNAPLLQELTTAIEERNAHKVRHTLETLATRSPSFRQLALVLPLRDGKTTTYLDIRRWTRAEHIFELDRRNRLAPNRFELAYLDRVSAERGKKSEAGVFVRRPHISIFWPINNRAGRTSYFLRSDDHRYGRKDYK